MEVEVACGGVDEQGVRGIVVGEGGAASLIVNVRAVAVDDVIFENSPAYRRTDGHSEPRIIGNSVVVDLRIGFPIVHLNAVVVVVDKVVIDLSVASMCQDYGTVSSHIAVAPCRR